MVDEGFSPEALAALKQLAVAQGKSWDDGADNSSSSIQSIFRNEAGSSSDEEDAATEAVDYDAMEQRTISVAGIDVKIVQVCLCSQHFFSHISCFAHFRLQAETAFGGSGTDDSGTVVWGAALHLARWVVENAAQLVKGRQIAELGCGCAIVSLCAAKSGARHVLV